MLKQKLKIVYIINSFALGGAEKLLLDFCQNLDKEKFEIYICSAVAGGPLVKEFEKADLSVKIFHKKSKLGLTVIWQLRAYLKALNAKPKKGAINKVGSFYNIGG